MKGVPYILERTLEREPDAFRSTPARPPAGPCTGLMYLYMTLPMNNNHRSSLWHTGLSETHGESQSVWGALRSDSHWVGLFKTRMWLTFLVSRRPLPPQNSLYLYSLALLHTHTHTHNVSVFFWIIWDFVSYYVIIILNYLYKDHLNKRDKQHTTNKLIFAIVNLKVSNYNFMNSIYLS